MRICTNFRSVEPVPGYTHIYCDAQEGDQRWKVVSTPPEKKIVGDAGIVLVTVLKGDADAFFGDRVIVDLHHQEYADPMRIRQDQRAGRTGFVYSPQLVNVCFMLSGDVIGDVDVAGINPKVEIRTLSDVARAPEIKAITLVEP